MAQLKTLPCEILLMIVRRIRIQDAKRLSQVSRAFHQLVKDRLWSCITVEPRENHTLSLVDSVRLSPEHLRLVKQLHVRARPFGGGYPDCWETCPHETDRYYRPNWSGSDQTDAAPGEYPRTALEPRIDYRQLEKEVISMLERLEPGQLRAFGWDLGTCVPTQILGPGGIIALEHPNIASLVLTTRQNCDPSTVRTCLATFQHLQRLSWRTPRPTDIATLSAAVERNAKHLEELELTLMYWPMMKPLSGARQVELPDPVSEADPSTSDSGSGPSSQVSSSEEEGEKQATNPKGYGKSYTFDRRILRRGGIRRSPIMLPALRALTLSSVVLVHGSLDFPALECLTLRRCPGWDTYLASALRLKRTIRLRTLEVSADVHHVVPGFGEETLLEFLGVFGTLQELFVSLPVPTDTLGLLGCAASCHPHLRRFVSHPKAWSNVLGSRLRGARWGYDLPTMGITGAELTRLALYPSKNPVACLDLEGIGLACVPEYLPSLLRPFMSKPSLKVIHVRQSCDDLFEAPHSVPDPLPSQLGRGRKPWREAVWHESGASSDVDLPAARQVSKFLAGGTEKNSAEGTGEDTVGKDVDPSATENNTTQSPSTEFRAEFLQFIRFIFSPIGVRSLRVLLCGNFDYELWDQPGNAVFVRSDTAACGFRSVSVEGEESREIFEDYGDMVGACPSIPFSWK